MHLRRYQSFLALQSLNMKMIPTLVGWGVRGFELKLCKLPDSEWRPNSVADNVTGIDLFDIFLWVPI